MVFYFLPIRRPTEGSERLKAPGVLGDEGMVQHRRAARLAREIVRFDQPFAKAGQNRQIAPGLDLMVLGRNPRGRAGGHLQGILGVGKPFKAAFTQRIEGHDWHAAAGGGLQVVQHARAIGADVLPKKQDGVGLFEVFKPNRAYGCAQALLESHRCGLVAHVGAVRQVLAAIHPGHQSVHVGRFDGGASRRVEDDRLRIQAFQLGADDLERLVPPALDVLVRCSIIAQRRGQAARLLQLEVAPPLEFRKRIPGEELGRAAALGEVPDGRLGAILTEFRRMGVRRL